MPHKSGADVLQNMSGMNCWLPLETATKEKFYSQECALVVSPDSDATLTTSESPPSKAEATDCSAM